MSEAKDSDITVSIIVPVYNAENFLDQALSSLQAQEDPCLEFICLNDGSTDASLSIMKRYAERDARFRIIDKHNEGYGASCNRGIEESCGEYVAVFEPDDWIEGNMYGDLIEFASRFDEPVEVIKSSYWVMRNPDTPAEHKMLGINHKQVKVDHQPFTLKDAPQLIAYHPSIWSALYRKSFLDDRHIRFRAYPGAGWVDNPFLIETLCQAKSIAYLDKPYYCYREDTPEEVKRFTMQNPTLPLERWLEMADAIEELGVSDKGILSAHYRRGFAYIDVINRHAELSDPAVHTSLSEVFSRMDPALVFSEKSISPTLKRLFAETRGLDMPRINPWTYPVSRIQQELYSFQSLGLRASIDRVKNYLKRGNARADKS